MFKTMFVSLCLIMSSTLCFASPNELMYESQKFMVTKGSMKFDHHRIMDCRLIVNFPDFHLFFDNFGFREFYNFSQIDVIFHPGPDGEPSYASRFTVKVDNLGSIDSDQFMPEMRAGFLLMPNDAFTDLLTAETGYVTAYHDKNDKQGVTDRLDFSGFKEAYAVFNQCQQEIR